MNSDEGGVCYQNVLQKLSSSLKNVEILKNLETKTGIPLHQYLVLVLLILIGTLLYLAGPAKLIGFLAFSFPAYHTFRALEGDDIEEHHYWLLYWIVYGFFHIFEMFGDFVFSWSLYWVPLKVLVLLWLLFPATEGSVVIYEYLIRPHVTHSNRRHIDHNFGKVQENMMKMGRETFQVIKSIGADSAQSIIHLLVSAKKRSDESL